MTSYSTNHSNGTLEKITLKLLNKLALMMTNTSSFGSYFEPIAKLFSKAHRVGISSAKVTNVCWESSDIYSLTLKPNGRRFQRFKAGQFIQIEVEKNGRRFQRCFSISSSPVEFKRDGTIELSIRTQEGGAITPWLSKALSTGATIHISQAMGEFTLKNMRANKLFIAGGSGITPVLSILKEGIHQEWFQDATLLYYTHDEASMPFKAELAQLEKSGLNTQLVYTQTQGRLKQEHIQNLCSDVLEREVYICGPSGMIESGISLLSDMGLSQEHLNFEYFGPAPLIKSVHANDTSNEQTLNISYTTSVMQSVTSPENNESLLNLAEQAGLKPVSGCRIGVCHQCICKKTKGRVLNTKTNIVSDSGTEDIQLCLSVPLENVALAL